jgi:hypothetical protein
MIMAKQATNRVSTIKLSDGQYIQAGQETLKGLFKFTFLIRSWLMIHMMTDRSAEPGHMRNHNEQRGWNLTKRVNNQSTITWALGTFKPFKSAGSDGIVPAILQQGAEHTVPHLCRIFRACMAYETMLGGSLVTTAWRVLRLRMEETPSSFGG